MTSTHSRSLLLFTFAASLGAVACGTASQRDRQPAGGPAVTVEVMPAAVARIPTRFEAGGIVRARRSADISSRVMAPITRIHVRPGDRVRAGQPLVELDARQLDAEVRRSAAALVAGERAAGAADADMDGAEASLTFARATRDRVAQLFDRRSATPQERDAAEAELGAAAGRATGAQARAAEALAGVEAAKAAADVASIAASYAVLIAPFDAVVADRRADPGDMAAPGVPLLVVEDLGGWQLEVRLDEARASGVALQQPVQVAFDAPPHPDPLPRGGGEGGYAAGLVAPLMGHVVEIGRADSASHTFVIKIDLPAGASLRSGVFGRALFEGPARRALAIPASAVVRRGQLSFVFTAANGVARLRPVSIGPASGASIEVTAGISPGDLIVTNPPASLIDGAKVNGAGTGAGR